MNDIRWTRHVFQRGRSRLGLPRRAMRRMGQLAWREGETAETAEGLVGVHLRGVLTAHRIIQADRGVAPEDATLRLYGRVVWLFAEGRLITCWRLDANAVRMGGEL